MLEELKKKNKTYEESRRVLHSIDNYEELILNEIKGNLSGIGYEKAYEIYEDLKGDHLTFPLQSVNEGIFDVTPDFLLVQNKLITNERTRFQNFFKELKNELRTCKKFYLMVSFIRYSGLQLLLKELIELEKNGIQGEIITSTYMNITEPKALSKLLSLKNIKIKLYRGSGESFHTKAYLFERDNALSSIILGSSNISHEALCNGKEWNLRLSQKLEPKLFESSIEEFKKIWFSNEAIFLTEELIEKYSFHFQKFQNAKFEDFLHQKEDNEIKPNNSQEKILENLKNLRTQGKKKSLVIAATGTGKTYLSAFDVRNFGAHKVCFIAHREELLDNGMETFKKIFPIVTMGKLSANEKSFNSNFLFSTVQSLSKNLDKFSKDSFDYVIIDEFHHAAADSYREILDYFDPKFLLGLTATPERMDGKDVMALCDYNIAGEIRLREALERELLVPFHYFGIADETVDYNNIRKKNGKFDENDLSEKLSINERSEFIIDKIKLYDYNGDSLKAIAFCVDIKHAKKMSNDFSSKGYKASFITSKDSMEKRQNTLYDFRNGLIEIICTVDIFNEGIDIPEINMLLFLRPTQSSTIFTQQLGRGLRKTSNKAYVTVLDFIGNYNKDFMLSKIFVEKYQKNDVNILKNEILQEFHNLPQSSFVELDRICQKRILDNMEKVKLNSTSSIITSYENFKESLGAIPKFMDFLFGELELSLIINAFNSYAKFLEKYEKLQLNFNGQEFDFIELLEKKLPIKWPYEFMLIKLLMKQTEVSPSQLIAALEEEYSSLFDCDFHLQLINNLVKELGNSFIKYDDNSFKLSQTFESSLKNSNFNSYITDLCNYALKSFSLNFNTHEFAKHPLVLYNEYSRVELQYLLQSSAEKGSWRAGYSIAEKDICLFITLNKDENIDEHLKYDNFFKGQDIVQWISQNKTSHDSPIGKLYVNHKEEGYTVHVFIRKYSVFLGKAMDFVYLGKSDYFNSHGDKPMYILWKLHNKIPNELYLDFS